MTLFVDPDKQAPPPPDPNDPWDQQERDELFLAPHVYLQKCMDLQAEQATLQGAPDGAQFVQLLNAEDLNVFMITFDEVSAIYRRSLVEIDAPLEHVHRVIHMLGRTAAYVEGGAMPLLEQIGGLYMGGQKIDAAQMQANAGLVACGYCGAAAQLHNLRCGNCGAALPLE